MITFAKFKEYLDILHKMEMDVETEFGPLNSGNMMYNNAKSYVDADFFSYEYDSLTIVVLRFNEDETVDEWFEQMFEDLDYENPDQTHDSVSDWMNSQIEAITP